MFSIERLTSSRIKTTAVCEVIIGIVFLICGCAIYLLFRSKHLNIYLWCESLGLSSIIDFLRFEVQDWHISSYTRYSFPDGLYCAAYILIIDAIWSKDNSPIKYIIISLVPLITITSELFQYFGLVKGTFDVYDLISYTIPPAIYLIYIHNSHKFNNLKIKRLWRSIFYLWR